MTAMLHFEAHLSEYAVILSTLIIGVFFWVAVISAIALVMVADRVIEELLSDEDDEIRAHNVKDRATLDEDT